MCSSIKQNWSPPDQVLFAKPGENRFAATAVATAGVQNAEELYNLAATNRFEGDCKNESESEPKAESS